MMLTLPRLYFAFLIFFVMAVAEKAKGHEHITDPLVRQWYETRQLTPAARKRLGYTSCCGSSDVVKTQFRVNRADGGDEWFWLKDGTWERVPPDIIHWNQHAPSGAPTLFAVGGTPTCFFPPGAGI